MTNENMLIMLRDETTNSLHAYMLLRLTFDFVLVPSSKNIFVLCSRKCSKCFSGCRVVQFMTLIATRTAA
jgi:hypothetical protein